MRQFTLFPGLNPKFENSTKFPDAFRNTFFPNCEYLVVRYPRQISNYSINNLNSPKQLDSWLQDRHMLGTIFSDDSKRVFTLSRIDFTTFLTIFEPNGRRSTLTLPYQDYEKQFYASPHTVSLPIANYLVIVELGNLPYPSIKYSVREKGVMSVECYQQTFFLGFDDGTIKIFSSVPQYFLYSAPTVGGVYEDSLNILQLIV